MRTSVASRWLLVAGLRMTAVSFVLDKGVKNALEVARLLREARAADAGANASADGSTAQDEEE